MAGISPLYTQEQEQLGVSSLYSGNKATKISPLYTGDQTTKNLPMLSMEEIDPDFQESIPEETVTIEEAEDEPEFDETQEQGQTTIYTAEDDLESPVDDVDSMQYDAETLLPPELPEDEPDDLEAAQAERTPLEILDDAFARFEESIKSGEEYEKTIKTSEFAARTQLEQREGAEAISMRVFSDPNLRQYLDEKTEAEIMANVESFGGTTLLSSDEEITVEAITNQKLETLQKNYDKTKAYLESRNFVTSNLSEVLITAVDSGFLTLPQLNAIVLGDEFINPATAVVEVPHYFADVQENIRDGEYGSAAFNTGLAALNMAAALPLTRVVQKGVNKVWSTLSGGGKAHGEIIEAAANEAKLYDEKVAAARKVANDNKETRTQLIREMEENLSPKDGAGNIIEDQRVKISKELEDGNLELDPALVRAAGTKKISEYYSDMGYVGNDGKTVKLTDYAINDSALALPILDPDKMDIFVATVIDLKSNPKFAEKLNKKGQRLVDNIFDLTLEKDLLASEELLDVLNKNGLTFEEYVLGVVGSGSQAGKLLNRLSTIKRIKPKSLKEQQEIEAKIATQNALGKMWNGSVLRTENIRRGLMVSSLATAMRNYQSALIRAPMESLSDVMDTAILTYGNSRHAGDSRAKALVKFHNSVNPLVRDGTWSGSLNNLRYMFYDQGRAEEFTDYILDRPELAEQFERMFNSIGEIQKATGRGQATSKMGHAIDKVMSRAEDFAWAVNAPNRWQEHMIRRATFMAELERQVKVKWGGDLQTIIKEGRIQELLNDAPTVRPEDGESFINLIETATTKALDVTYALPPDLEAFKMMSEFITKTGATVIIPFPRFMFRSMEYMGQNVGGIGQVAFRKAMFKEAREAGLTARDRQDITRNLVGLAAMSGMYQYYTSEHATEDYTMMAYEDKQVDITAQYPLRQFSWVVNLAKRVNEGTEDTWSGLNMEEITETFLGTAARTGVGNVFIDEMTELIKGTEDIIDENRRAKTIGRLLGQYTNTFLTPVFQMTEAQRVSGRRTGEAKDFSGSIPNIEVQMQELEQIRQQFGKNSPEAQEAEARLTQMPYTESTFMRSFYEQMARRGLAAPSFEEELPNRVTIDQGQVERPDTATRLYSGITIMDRDSDTRNYLKQIGFADATYELGSKSRIPENRLAENEFISNLFPLIVDAAKVFAEDQHTRKRNQNVAARKFIREGAEMLRQEFNDPNLGSADQRSIIADSMRRLSADDRKYGIMRFKEMNNGRLPRLTSLEDLLMLLELSKVKMFDDL